MIALAAAAIVMVLAMWARPHLCVPRGRANGGRRRARRHPPTTQEWAAALDSMSAEVRTGSSLSVALQRSLLRTPLSGQAITPTATLATLATAPTTDPDEAVVVHTLRATHALGGPIAATLDGSSALLRERAAIRSEAMAYSAQARLSARVLTSVPLGFAGWSLLSSYSFRMALLSPPGLASASIGALCNLGGWWWMHRIIRKAGE